MSVMSAAGARQAAGAGHQSAVPRPRIANPAADPGAPFGAGPGPRDGTPGGGRRSRSGELPGDGDASRADGRPSAPVTELRMEALEVTRLRMTQIRTVAAVVPPCGSGSPDADTVAGREAARHVSAVRTSARHVSAVRTSASHGSAVPAQAVRASARRAPASQEAASHASGRQGPATHRAAATGYSRPDGSRPAAPGSVRLTKRGRRAVAGLALAVTAALVVLIWLAAASGAAAAEHGLPARAAYQGLTQVVVRPGQTLWSIAAAAEPSADPRIVVQQIIETNALSGATIHTGQLLWVPKG